MEILNRINAASAIPVYLQVADAILTGIQTGVLKRDRKLPSINKLSESNYISRDTVSKAYDVLRKRGVVNSIRTGGFYVKDNYITTGLSVLLLLNKLSAHKKHIYYALLKNLGAGAVVNLHVHHADGKICERLIEENLARYSYIAVLPHFNKNMEYARQAIRKVPKEQLLLLDKKLDDYEGKCAAVYQDFEGDIRNALNQGKDLLARYSRLTLVQPSSMAYPKEILKGFRLFCQQSLFEHNVIDAIKPQLELKGTAFVVLDESDLVDLIALGKQKGLSLGKDYGMISYNDNPLKEVLENGITVISTDHVKMGETAAYLMKHGLKEQQANPFTLIRRNSL
ncbi:GntR family transcriptional regulator [Pontibacter qinzhouensis]|uniref:GntR family transcriptional regulator n=1 Tax=Pontibacter qinzhouensis TaxID=2603253 RepID=A0A5C8K0R1_9BACT|nr:GntR family transcriptional regulator [Pontibacter qinzhouensis]TXK44300.1 GntR family transcriptional regulator [Pontibacter qinzhouensis]